MGGQHNIICDNTGENISSKNSNYCELTACYWIWKNDIDNDYVGICHYRRFFMSDTEKILSKEEIASLFAAGYDVILPEQVRWKKESVGSYYVRSTGYKKDLNNCKEIIKKRYPEYISSFDKVINGNTASYANMLICNKSVYDEYCTWLFDILFELEKITDMTGYTQAEHRIFGYLSELLINVFVSQRKYRIKHFPVIMVGEMADSRAQRKMKIKRQLKEAVKHIIWFPTGIKPARRKE